MLLTIKVHELVSTKPTMFSGVRQKTHVAAMAAHQALAVRITTTISLAAERVVNAVVTLACLPTANVARLHPQAMSIL